jgi:hypothetical protein
MFGFLGGLTPKNPNVLINDLELRGTVEKTAMVRSSERPCKPRFRQQQWAARAVQVKALLGSIADS